MKTEVISYQTPADYIQSFVERRDDQGKDTFDMSDWWKANCAKLPAFSYVLSTCCAQCCRLNSPTRSQLLTNGVSL
jgi:hypothetical protein